MKLKITRDIDPCSPREFGAFGTFYASHPRYQLGDGPIPEDWTRPEGAAVLPVYLMDHSGLSVSTTPFGCPWDSGLVGWIFATKEQMAEAGVTPTQALDALREDIYIYNQYLTGEVWGWEVVEMCSCCGKEKDVIDSCWGHIGDSLEECGFEVPSEVDDQLEAAWEARG